MTQPQDIVITGAEVFTYGIDSPRSSLLAVRGDRIVALGTEPVSEVLGPRTRVINALGPGWSSRASRTPTRTLHRQKPAPRLAQRPAGPGRLTGASPPTLRKTAGVLDIASGWRTSTQSFLIGRCS